MGRTPRIPDQLKDGPFSLEEARAAGLTLSALRGKSWQRIGARLYRWRRSPDDMWAVIDAVHRTLPTSAVFIGRTAAWMHGLDVPPSNPIQVAVDNLEARDGLEVRHSDVTGEQVDIRGMSATSIKRTLLDLCLWSPAVEALVVIDNAVRIGLTSPGRLRGYGQGRAGGAQLRALADIAAPAESPMETRLRWLLLAAGLPKPGVQADLYDDAGRFLGRADLFYTSANLIIEFDGGNHRDRLVDDDRRQNRLVDAGYRILRFTAADVRGHPQAVVEQVTKLLRAGRPSPPQARTSRRNRG